MSVSQYVFIEGGRMPTAERIQASINDLGIDLHLAPDVVLADHSGYWPVTTRGEPSGFECSVDTVREVFGEDAPHGIGARDLVVEFVTHSDMRELACACYVAAALIHAADGLALDVYDETGTIVGVDRVLEEARAAEAANG